VSAPEPSLALTATELIECEAVIARGLVAAGQALRRIRDGRLYRESYSTFEDYCKERWQMNRAYANRQIEAASVAKVLDPIGSIPSEAVARELAPLRGDPEKMAEAWRETIEQHGEKPTAADVREKVRDKMGVHYSSETPEWGTPQSLFDELNIEFGFELDVCATPELAKCERYFSLEQDGLAQEWTGICWMNPPYGNVIGDWIEKAVGAAEKASATVVCLVPARVDTGWWWDYCRFGEIRFLRGRLSFEGAESSAPFPSAVVIFRPRAKSKVVWWER
jgi:phage N-6-adenine-methyltransferase